MVESIYSALLKSVAFVTDEFDKPCGTAFFISVQDALPSELSWEYMVTNKHVIQLIDRDPNGTFNGATWRRRFKLRLNSNSSKVIFFDVDLDALPDAPIEHPDLRIDLVALRIPNLPSSELAMLDSGVVFGSTRPSMLPIVEGIDVVNCSLLDGYYGAERNYPICRFGKVALRTDEFWCETNRGHGKELAWIVDLGCEEGSSGSPVFSSPVQQIIDFQGNPVTHMGTFALIGVVKAISDSKTDYARKMRALTLVEPIQSLQEIFKDIVSKLQKAGHNPQAVHQELIFVPNQIVE